jgi:DmsE family decaheme c-type cytochrome
VHAAARPDSEVSWSARAELCMNCHTDVRSEMRKTSHHPVREGKMDCLSCHDPHGTLTKGNLRAASVNELCYDCHTEKRGPFLWEHAPVRESCLTCHTPHGSNHLKLQSTSVPYLCQQCHSNTRHPGTLYDATRLPTLENPSTGSNRLFNRACVDCHAAVHGSNHPSSPYLAH